MFYLANVNFLNEIIINCEFFWWFFFIPNSHGFMGKERVTNKQKLETMTALHWLTPAFPEETLPS